MTDTTKATPQHGVSITYPTTSAIRHDPSQLPTRSRPKFDESKTALDCIVCEPLRVLNEEIEEMCKQGRLEDEFALQACNWHEEEDLRAMSDEVVSLLNAVHRPPTHPFGDVVLRGKTVAAF